MKHAGERVGFRGAEIGMSLPVEHISVAFGVRLGRENRFMFHLTLFLVSEDILM